MLLNPARATFAFVTLSIFLTGVEPTLAGAGPLCPFVVIADSAKRADDKLPDDHPLLAPVFDKEYRIQKGTTFLDLSPIGYDVQVAQRTGLSEIEVMALRKNFSGALPSTGEIGIFAKGDEYVLDPTKNLVAGYMDFKARFAERPLRAQDIIDLRVKVYESRSANGRSDRINIPFRFKENSSSHLDFEIPDYVQKRLEHYGLAFKIENGHTKIIYPAHSGQENLEKFADEINQMVKRGDPPERITAFAAQDLLILHPFKDGNGRTARIVAQVIYEALAKKSILFPEAFYHEMEYSLDDLAGTIRYQPPVHQNLSDVRRLADLVRQTYAKGHGLPVMVDASLIESKAPRLDVPFPESFTDLGGKKVRYSELPVQMKQSEPFVFYGRRGGDTIAEAEETAIKVMKYGRGSRAANPHLDLRLHVKSTASEGASGFFSASERLPGAVRFAVGYYGVIYVIDARGAEVLNVNEISQTAPDSYYAQTEYEVLFGPRLNPARIQAAAIYDGSRREFVKILLNPDYVPGHQTEP